jgi:hypothetical protein
MLLTDETRKSRRDAYGRVLSEVVSDFCSSTVAENREETHLIITWHQEITLRRRNNTDSALQSLTANAIVRLLKHWTNDFPSHCDDKSAYPVPTPHTVANSHSIVHVPLTSLSSSLTSSLPCFPSPSAPVTSAPSIAHLTSPSGSKFGPLISP